MMGLLQISVTKTNYNDHTNETDDASYFNTTRLGKFPWIPKVPIEEVGAEAVNRDFRINKSELKSYAVLANDNENEFEEN